MHTTGNRATVPALIRSSSALFWYACVPFNEHLACSMLPPRVCRLDDAGQVERAWKKLVFSKLEQRQSSHSNLVRGVPST